MLSFDCGFVCKMNRVEQHWFQDLHCNRGFHFNFTTIAMRKVPRKSLGRKLAFFDDHTLRMLRDFLWNNPICSCLLVADLYVFIYFAFQLFLDYARPFRFFAVLSK